MSTFSKRFLILLFFTLYCLNFLSNHFLSAVEIELELAKNLIFFLPIKFFHFPIKLMVELLV